MYDLLTYAKICSRSVEKSGVDALKDTLKTMFPVDGIRIEENGTDPVYVPGFPYHMYVVLPGCRFINWRPWRKSDLGVIQVVFNCGENECPISHFEVPVGFSEENKAVLEKTCSPERAFWLAYQAVNYSPLKREVVDSGRKNMDERNWTASITLENLTQEQIDELIVKLIEIVEGMGGFVGGGFMPAKELAQIERAAYQEARAALLPFARTSHRAQDLGLIEDKEDRHD